MLNPGELQRIRAGIQSTGPSSELAVEAMLALEVAGHILGAAWVRQHVLHESGSKGAYLPSLTAPYDVEQAWRLQHQLTELAHLLYEAQTLPGFREAVQELRTRSMRGVVVELRTAVMLRMAGHEPRLVQRTGRKGADYDIAVPFGEVQVAVEVKSKEEDTPYDEGTVRATLRDARQQLPQEGPGVVVLAVPRNWTAGDAVQAEVVETVLGSLRNSRRINAVVLLWEAVAQSTTGQRAYANAYLPVWNPQPRASVAGLDSLIREIAPGAPYPMDSPRFVRDSIPPPT